MKDFNIKEHLLSVEEVKELFPGLREIELPYELSDGTVIPWNKGKKGLQVHSEDTKKKMSDTMKKKWANGRPITDEHRAKLKKQLTGHTHWLGRKHSTDTIDKMKKNHVGMKGRKHSPETIAKMKLAQQKRRKNGLNI